MTDLWRIVSGPGSQVLHAAIATQIPVELEIEFYDRPDTRRRVWAMFVRATQRPKTRTWDIQSFYLYDGPDRKNRVGGGGGGEYDATRADGYPIKHSYVGRLHLDKV
ncbi:hypothetical protein KBD18_01815 [Patescibacteria group bacterium]|nr:hypothetical protein [Patescibacteria group bacterium]